MKILDCHEIGTMTVLFLDEELPLTDWRRLYIAGNSYEPRMIMDAGKNVIAVDGAHDFTGKTIEFV